MAATPTVFVDANVLLHAFDDNDLDKQQRSRQWLTECWLRRCGRLSNPVLNEFYANARKRFATAISAGDARAEVRRYQVWLPWQIDQPTVETAWAAESRYQLSYWDALMVAAAQHMGCSFLLTEDLPHDQRIDKLRVLNPFLVGPELLDEPTTETP
ncbi:PIN domain-containing protein [Roseateles cellulosilyticus]|uniref:PIN domain-containing protein n=1 Tax=Pelomonas cellulosilytica TaxID=2906762 RepID=A0ABS8Y247_9BURK|nr:PIN domain-containing protein [Pelomonas sp. P8]MCE4557016.1 PIN domain-containing protein [Pelomonas sp. P8]